MDQLNIFSKSSLRRSRFQIDIDVLRTISGGETKPTRIMYANHLSWKALNNMFERLISLELIRTEIIPGNKRSKTRYFITPKGEKAIESVTKLEGLLTPVTELRGILTPDEC